MNLQQLARFMHLVEAQAWRNCRMHLTEGTITERRVFVAEKNALINYGLNLQPQSHERR